MIYSRVLLVSIILSTSLFLNGHSNKHLNNKFHKENDNFIQNQLSIISCEDCLDDHFETIHKKNNPKSFELNNEMKQRRIDFMNRFKKNIEFIHLINLPTLEELSDLNNDFVNNDIIHIKSINNEKVRKNPERINTFKNKPLNNEINTYSNPVPTNNNKEISNKIDPSFKGHKEINEKDKHFNYNGPSGFEIFLQFTGIIALVVTLVAGITFAIKKYKNRNRKTSLTLTDEPHGGEYVPLNENEA